MKIVNKNSKGKVTLKKIARGECFTYCRAYYMKTDEITCEREIKVVQLNSGILCHYDLDEEVTPVNAEVRILEED